MAAMAICSSMILVIHGSMVNGTNHVFRCYMFPMRIAVAPCHLFSVLHTQASPSNLAGRGDNQLLPTRPALTKHGESTQPASLRRGAAGVASVHATPLVRCSLPEGRGDWPEGRV
jgi:hypothetical protein